MENDQSSLTKKEQTAMTTLTEYEKDQVRSLYYDGMNPEDIAEELNLDELAVMDYCSELFK